MAPHGVYPCAGSDQWIAITVANDVQWQALVEAMGRPAWALEARWQTLPQRHRERKALDTLIAAWTAGQDKQELMLQLQAKGVPAGAVQDAHDVTRVDPQLAHRGHWVRLPHAEMGESIYNNLPFRFSRTPVRPQRGAPLLGEHTREVLQELLGFSQQEIDQLQAEEVLK
jgi:benzylsuccinate CoA-transferase BbsF subunit